MREFGNLGIREIWELGNLGSAGIQEFGNLGIREIQECGNSGIRGIRELGNSGIWELGNSGQLRTAGNESGSASQIPGIDSQRGCGRWSTPVPPGGVGSRSGGAFQVFSPLAASSAVDFVQE